MTQGAEDVQVSIVIVNRNTRDLLRDCLSSLPDGCEGVSYEVWVGDNASTDGSVELVESSFPDVHLVSNDRNLGFAAANNLVLRRVTSPMALLLNSDTVVPKHSVSRLHAFLTTHPNAAMVGPRLIGADGLLQASTYPIPQLWTTLLATLKVPRLLPHAWAGPLFQGSFWDHASTRRVGRLKGACILVRMEDLRASEFLNEDFFFYGEVHDLCWSLLKKGRETWFCHESEVIHLGGQTPTETWNGRERRRRMWREYERLLYRHLPTYKARLNIALSWSGITLRSAVEPLVRRLGVSKTDADLLEVDRGWYSARVTSWLRALAEGSLQFIYTKSVYENWFRGRLRHRFALGVTDRHAEEAAKVRERVIGRAQDVRDQWPSSGMMEFESATLAYEIIRSFKPNIVLETGVANGVSSTFILAALEANGSGQLYSIDPGDPADCPYLPEGKDVGWMVPEELQERWHFVRGSAEDELERILDAAGSIEVFLHDSDHSYDAMKYEFLSVWPYLVDGGFLLSDDSRMNTAFAEFAGDFGQKSLVHRGRLGIVKKSQA